MCRDMPAIHGCVEAWYALRVVTNASVASPASRHGAAQKVRVELCALQFEAFARGFMMLCGGPAIHLFSATELERLVCGNPLLDFDAMQANARYDGGYSPEHRVSPGATPRASA